MSQSHLRTLTEVAIFSALAIILDNIIIFTMPQGGSVSLVMLPIVFIALRQGLGYGILTGFVVGCVQLISGAYFLNVFQVFLDYALAYAGVGVAGIFSSHFQSKKTTTQAFGIILGASLCSGFVRFIGNFLSGIIFYADYAPKGTPVWLYSFTYNISYILPATILVAVLLFILYKSRPIFFKAH